MCRVLRQCGETLGLSLDGQLTLYRVFERQVIERLGDLFERINATLAHEGILPGLIYHPIWSSQRRCKTGGLLLQRRA